MNDRKTTGNGLRGVTPGGMAILRAAVAVYLIYLGFTVIRNSYEGGTTMSPTLAWLFGILFMAAGGAFAWFTWRRFRKESAEARDAQEAAESEKTEDSDRE